MRKGLNSLKNKYFIIFSIVLISTIIICTIPMNLSPVWNGEIKEHRNQYELLADSFLNGHLYIDYNDIDKKLLDMENPYDPIARNRLNVSFHWDHAFYKGKYYVYFGVAPVIFTFIPYKLITGHSLNTYHATQLYTTLFIIGLFVLLYNFFNFFNNKKFGLYLLLSSSFSIISVWICTSRPSLYCTSISSGLCMVVWSLYFYLKAVYGNYKLKKAIVYATIGGLFGALTFACRPPLGLINILAIPLLITFFKKYGFNKKNILKILIILIPYIIIGTLLMIYNYIRFDNIFEFGQSYQLTLADQHNYLNKIDIDRIFNGLKYYFFEHQQIYNMFPYINISGVFINYPIMLLPFILFISRSFRKNLIKKQLLGFYITLMILPLIIAIFDTMNALILNERYRLDVYFIMCILTFISIMNYLGVKDNKTHIFTFIVAGLAILSIIISILLFFVPLDGNFTFYYPNINPSINDYMLKLIRIK